MSNCFIILAGGESKRFNSKIPKTYSLYKGKPLILHSINKVQNCKKINKIVVVINKKHKKFIKKLNIKDMLQIDFKKIKRFMLKKLLSHLKYIEHSIQLK